MGRKISFRILRKEIGTEKDSRLGIYTYKEIVAFTNGEKLDGIEKAREEGKRTYENIAKALAGAHRKTIKIREAADQALYGFSFPSL